MARVRKPFEILDFHRYGNQSQGKAHSPLIIHGQMCRAKDSILRATPRVFLVY